MRKILLLILILSALAFCTQTIFQTAGKWNTAVNWSGGSVPDSAADTCTISAACTLDVEAKYRRLVKRNSHPFIATGFKMSSVFGTIIDSASILKLGTYLGKYGDGDTVHIGAAVALANVTAAQCTLDISGTSHLDLDNAAVYGPLWGPVTGKTLTSISSAQSEIRGSKHPFTGRGGTVISISNGLVFGLTALDTFCTGTAIWQSGSGGVIYFVISAANTRAIMPALTATSTGSIVLRNGSATFKIDTIDYAGPLIHSGTVTMQSIGASAGEGCTHRFLSGSRVKANAWNIYTQNAACNTRIHLGSSIDTCTTLNTTTYDVDTSFIDLDTATVYITGASRLYSTQTAIIPDRGTMIFTGATSQKIKNLTYGIQHDYNVIKNGSGSLTDSTPTKIIIDGTLTSTAGTFNIINGLKCDSIYLSAGRIVIPKGQDTIGAIKFIGDTLNITGDTITNTRSFNIAGTLLFDTTTVINAKTGSTISSANKSIPKISQTGTIAYNGGATFSNGYTMSSGGGDTAIWQKGYTYVHSKAVSINGATVNAWKASATTDRPPYTVIGNKFDAYYKGCKGQAFTPGQSATSNTVDAASVGDTILLCANTTGLVPNLLIAYQSPAKYYSAVIKSIVPNTSITLKTPLEANIASSAIVNWWVLDSAHPSVSGGAALADYWYDSVKVAYPAIDSGKHGFFGDSWISRGDITNRLKVRISAADSFADLGHGGDQTTALIARYAADVRPLGLKYLWITVGVNDAIANRSAVDFQTNITTLANLCKSDSITPLFLNCPPYLPKLDTCKKYADNTVYTGTIIPLTPILLLAIGDTTRVKFYSSGIEYSPNQNASDGTSIDGGGNININFGVDTIPIIDSIIPNHCKFGDTITLKGAIFGNAPTVTVAGGLVPSISRDSVHFKFTAPNLSSGIKQVVLTNNIYLTKDTITISYDTLLRVDSIKPVWQKRGLTFKVRGHGFRATKSTGTIKLGTSNLQSVQLWSDTLIIDTIPASWSPKGTYNVIVESDYGYKDTGSIRVLIPTITPMTP